VKAMSAMSDSMSCHKVGPTVTHDDAGMQAAAFGSLSQRLGLYHS